MRKQFGEYHWLAGGYGIKGSIWEGPDHLLVIEGKGFLFAYREIYRRLDYKNIQALSMARSGGYMWGVVLLVLATALLGLIWFAAFSKRGLSPSVEVLALAPAATLTLLIVHLSRGATCRCSIQTAVLFLRLKTLKRQKIALPILERLHAAALRHQGEISPSMGLGTAPAASPFSPVSSAPLFEPQLTKPIWQGSLTARCCMIAWILWGLMFAGKLFVPGVIYFFAQGVVAAFAGLLTIIVLAQLHQYLLPKKRLRFILWLELAAVLIATVSCFILMIYTAVQSGPTQSADMTLPHMLESLGAVSYSSGSFSTVFFLSLGLGSALLGALGFPATLSSLAKNTSNTSPSSTPPSPGPRS